MLNRPLNNLQENNISKEYLTPPLPPKNDFFVEGVNKLFKAPHRNCLWFCEQHDFLDYSSNKLYYYILQKKTARGNRHRMRMARNSFPIKLYLQKWLITWIWPPSCSSLLALALKNVLTDKRGVREQSEQWILPFCFSCRREMLCFCF